jgi:hypothetical protein
MVRAAEKRFLALWAAHCLVQRAGNNLHDELIKEDPRLADPHNHDWSLLYEGSVLDD